MSRPHKRDKVAVVNPNTDETVIVSRANANDLVNLNGWSYASAKPAEQSVEDAEPTDATDTDENELETVPSPVAEETEHHKHRQETIEVKVQRNMSRQIWLMPQQGPRGSLGLGWNLSWGLAL